MRRLLFAFAVLVAASPVQAAGLLIPTEKAVPPLAMLNHQVNVSIEDQVAITKLEQTFRNHTDRQLEATYIFPVPKGASVRKFSMWVDGKEFPGELVEADKARKIYTDIVQRTLDPGLLEYMGNNLLRMRIFPVPPKADTKVMISFTSVATAENGLVEYSYPFKTDSKAVATLEKFSVTVNIKSQHPLTNLYSPSHAITVARPTDKHAVVAFEKDSAMLDRDFQLFYMAGGKDVGLTAITHRPGEQPGHFMLLVSPRAELSREQVIPRDMVLVLDTSGSMRGKRMTQARNALKYCLSNLNSKDNFAIINFATTVNKYSENLLPATSDNIAQARKWVEQLEATGGTAINDALQAAVAMRPNSGGRPFNIVFFTDGRPTIGETNTDKIVQNAAKVNTTGTRIFTFGVGDDVNASMLDQIAENSRALSSYVRETEDIESKVSSLYAKISNPVLSNLKLTLGDNVKISEVYPPQLPDLFHGTQLVVLGRYTGQGDVAVKLVGAIGADSKEFVYEMKFPEKTVGEDKTFIEDLWARRKVGYLLDQIRANGEKKELVDEVVTLAKRYGITTPYTSYLIVPDAPTPVVGGGGGIGKPRPVPLPNVRFNLGGEGKGETPPALAPTGGAKAPATVEDFIKQAQAKAGEAAETRERLAGAELDKADKEFAKPGLGGVPGNDPRAKGVREARDRLLNYQQAYGLMRKGNIDGVQAGRLGVDLSVDNNYLRNQSQVCHSASQYANARNCLEVGGVWIDEGYNAKLKTVTVKAMSAAYFRILEIQPKMRDVFRLGNHLVWVTPSGTALIIDMSTGQEEMTEAAIRELFVAPPATGAKKS